MRQIDMRALPAAGPERGRREHSGHFLPDLEAAGTDSGTDRRREAIG